jgi:hypothetical protein
MTTQSVADLIANTEPTLDKTSEEQAFNAAAQAYISKFGGSLPLGIGMPDLTVELLQAAIESGIEIAEDNIPEDAVA